MKEHTQIRLLVVIVVFFLVRGVSLALGIEEINNNLQANQGFVDPSIISALCYELKNLESFLYLFFVLIVVIAGPLLWRKKQCKARRRAMILKLKRIKKRADIEKRSI